MKKAEIQYQTFDESRRSAVLLAGLLIAEGHLKYIDDPVGMLNDSEHRIFAIPFRQYSIGEITFKEACNRLNLIRSEIQIDLSEEIHLDWLRVIHEKKTGRDFDQDRSALQGSDEVAAKDAAVHLVRSFDKAFSKNEDIKKLKLKAAVDGDEKFIDSIVDAHLNKPADKRKDFDLLSFKIFNETLLNDPKTTEREVIKRADEKKIYYQSEESLLKYLRRSGIKIKSGRGEKGDNRKKEIREYWNREFEKSVSDHKGEFHQYLLGDMTVGELKKDIQRFKELLCLK